MIDLSTGLQEIFLAHHDDFRRRALTVEAAVAAMALGKLGETLRAAAERDAHKLAGALGTFGLPHGSELARELEESLGARQRELPDASHLTGCIAALRREIDEEYARLGRGTEAASAAGVPVATVHRLRDPSERVADERRELRRATRESGLEGTRPEPSRATGILVVNGTPYSLAGMTETEQAGAFRILQTMIHSLRDDNDGA